MMTMQVICHQLLQTLADYDYTLKRPWFQGSGFRVYCCSTVTGLLHDCYRTVTGLLQDCYRLWQTTAGCYIMT